MHKAPDEIGSSKLGFFFSTYITEDWCSCRQSDEVIQIHQG